MTHTPPADGARPSDRYIPWLVVLFFLVFISVDAVMVTLAVRTHSGVVTEDAFEKGVAYNSTLAAVEAQAQTGWTHEMRLDGRRLQFTLRDAQGRAAQDAAMTVKIQRPTEGGHDFTVPMQRVEGQDYYEAALDVPMAGAWQVRVFATWQSKKYQAGQTFTIR